MKKIKNPNIVAIGQFQRWQLNLIDARLSGYPEALAALAPKMCADLFREMEKIDIPRTSFSRGHEASAKPKKQSLGGAKKAICALLKDVANDNGQTAFFKILLVVKTDRESNGAVSAWFNREPLYWREVENCGEYLAENIHQLTAAVRASDLSLVLDFLAKTSPQLESRFKSNVAKMASNDLVLLPNPLQAVLRRYGLPASTVVEAEISDPAQDTSTGQLALALLASWKVRNNSPQAQEAHDYLNGYARLYRHMSLFGTSGDVIPFDPEKVAAPNVDAGEKVKIIVPGVQMVHANRNRVILPAAGERA